MPTDALLHPLRTLELRREARGEPFSAASLRGELLDGLMDPFLVLDHFVMTGPFFAPHPHAGFSVATYLFEDSEDEFVNRDSLGDRSRIAPGGLLWIHAGGGVQHEENPASVGVRTHGLQAWVNVAREHKHDPPTRVRLEPGDVPEVHRPGGVRVRVLAGSLDGRGAPGELVTPIRWLEAHVPAGASVDLDAPAAQHTFALVIRGEGAFGPGDDAARLGAEGAAAFGRTGGVVRAKAGGDGLQFLLMSGAPIEEPVIWRGPFVGATDDDLRIYFERFRAGAMGTLPPAEETA
jgi:redox-sensitive bicupin YhaK (pirin superfamily)